MTTFAKLNDGRWGLRGKGLKTGQKVTVTKRSGETKTCVVERVLWCGQDGTQLASILVTTQKNGQHGAKVRQLHSGGNQETKLCWECGCRFTYADAKRGGGDWQDSYCGC